MHVFFQVTAYLVYLAAFVIGVILARQFEFGSFKLVSKLALLSCEALLLSVINGV